MQLGSPLDIYLHQVLLASHSRTNKPHQPPKPEQIYEAKFLVFDSCSRELLDRRLLCGETGLCGHNGSGQSDVSPATQPNLPQPACSEQKTNGQHCSVLHNPVFRKQPHEDVVTVFFKGMQSLQKTQYFTFQRCYLLPAVNEV